MNYFVSIENTTYDLWQIELLIESFKFHNLQDNLVIGIAGENRVAAKNLGNHKRIIHHQPHVFNSVYAVFSALQTGILTEPFVLLHPDMILYEPFKDVWTENIVFHPHPNDLKTTYEFMVGGVMRFNLIPYKFFQIVLDFATRIKNNKQENEKDIVRAAWTATLMHYINYASVIGQPLETSLQNFENNTPIIHYKNGFTSLFNKHMFYKQITMTDKNPYQTLLELNATTVTDYIQKIIRSYQK